MKIDDNFLDDILKEFGNVSDLPKTNDDDINSILEEFNQTFPTKKEKPISSNVTERVAPTIQPEVTKLTPSTNETSTIEIKPQVSTSHETSKTNTTVEDIKAEEPIVKVLMQDIEDAMFIKKAPINEVQLNITPASERSINEAPKAEEFTPKPPSEDFAAMLKNLVDNKKTVEKEPVLDAIQLEKIEEPEQNELIEEPKLDEKFEEIEEQANTEKELFLNTLQEKDTVDSENIIETELIPTEIIEAEAPKIPKNNIEVETKIPSISDFNFDTLNDLNELTNEPLEEQTTEQNRLDAFFDGYSQKDLDKLTIDETAFTDASNQYDFTDSSSSYRDFSNSMTSGNLFSGILGKFLNEKDDDEEPIPEYVHHKMPEIDDFTSYEDTEAVKSDLNHLKQSAVFRSIFATIFTLLLLYLNIGVFTPEILPDFLKPSISFFGFGATNVILLLGLIFAGAGTFFESIMKLFSLRPTGDSLASLALILSIAQGIYIATSPQNNNATPLVVSAIVAIAFTFSIYTKLMQVITISRGFNIISDTDDKYTLINVQSSELPVELKDNEKDLAAIAKTEFVENYLENSFCPNPSFKINRILIVVSLIGIVLTGIVGFIFHPIENTSAIYNALVAICCGSCISACFLNPATYILPSFIQNLKSSHKGGIVVGYDSVIESKEVLGVIAPDNLLLSGEDSKISGMKMLAKSEIYDVVTKLASIYNHIGGTLSSTFLKIIDNKKDLLQEITSVDVFENEGIKAVIEGLNIYVGNTKFLINSGILMPSLDYEEKFATETKKVIQVGFDGELRAVFVVEYKAGSEQYECIDMVDALGLSVITYTEDFNINTTVIKNALDAEGTDVMQYGPSTASQFKKLLSKKEKTKASIVSNGGLIGVLSAIRASRGISRSFKILSVIKCISVVLGLVLCAVMFYSGSPLPFTQLLLYQSIWTVLGVALSIF